MNDASTIVGNTAVGGGGGLYVRKDSGRFASPGTLTMTGSSAITGNSTGDRGGGMYAGPGGTLNGVSCGPQTLANVYGNTPGDCVIATSGVAESRRNGRRNAEE